MTLRTCMDCGLKAESEEDLENFVKKPDYKYNRMNLCKHCVNKRQKQKWIVDDRTNIKNRFRAAKNRCYNPNDVGYLRYGGRGITICQEWLDNPELFVDWALTNGFKRELEIDRIDNDKEYSPNNCHWVTKKDQARNRRDNTTDFERNTRICHKCGLEKPLDDFHRCRSQPAGRMYTCKVCSSNRRKSV